MLFYAFIHLYMLPYAFPRFPVLSCAFSTLFQSFPTLSYAFTCFYMLYLDKVSEQQQQEEKLPLCLTGFYLRKPVKTDDRIYETFRFYYPSEKIFLNTSIQSFLFRFQAGKQIQIDCYL